LGSNYLDSCGGKFLFSGEKPVSGSAAVSAKTDLSKDVQDAAWRTHARADAAGSAATAAAVLKSTVSSIPQQAWW